MTDTPETQAQGRDVTLKPLNAGHDYSGGNTTPDEASGNEGGGNRSPDKASGNEGGGNQKPDA